MHKTKSMLTQSVVYSAAQYFASTMMIVGMSVVVIVLQFHHHDPHGGKMPKWVSDLFKSICSDNIPFPITILALKCVHKV